MLHALSAELRRLCRQRRDSNPRPCKSKYPPSSPPPGIGHGRERGDRSFWSYHDEVSPIFTTAVAIHITDPRRDNAGGAVSMGLIFPSRPRWREPRGSPCPPTVPALLGSVEPADPGLRSLPFDNTSPPRPAQLQVEFCATKNPTGLSPWREGPAGFWCSEPDVEGLIGARPPHLPSRRRGSFPGWSADGPDR
jgi:hypothetical protein